MSSLDGILLQAPAEPPTLRLDTKALEPLGLVAAFLWVILALAAAAAVIVAVMVGWIRWKIDQIAEAPPLGQIADMAQAGLCAGFLTIVAVIAVDCQFRGWRAFDYFALTRPKGRYLLLGALALIAPLAWELGLYWCDISLQSPETEAAAPALAVTLIAAVLVAPFWEELIFRGFLYRTLAASRLGVAGAIIIPSLLWASIHFDRNWLGLVELFFCGLLWGWVRWRTQSTCVTLVVHFLNNGISGVALIGAALGWWS